MTVQYLGAILGAAIVWGCTASQTLMELTAQTTADNDGSEAPPFLLGVNTVTPGLPMGSLKPSALTPLQPLLLCCCCPIPQMVGVLHRGLCRVCGCRLGLQVHLQR